MIAKFPVWPALLVLAGSLAGCPSTVEQFAGLRCTADSDCPEPLSCVASECGTPAPAYGCTTNAMCGAGRVCELPSDSSAMGFCRGCAVDADCPTGHCLDGSHCVQCTGTADCAGGLRCELSTHTCVTDPRCEGPQDCTDGQSCTDGTCQAEGAP